MSEQTPGRTTSATNISDLLRHYRGYTQSRKEFLVTIGLSTSCRDPLAEFSEILAATLLVLRAELFGQDSA